MDPARRLQPVSMGTIFEISARILRRHWGTLLAVSVLLGVPGVLLSAVSSLPLWTTLTRILPRSGPTTSVTVSDADARALLEGLVLMIGGSVLGAILATVAAVGFAWVVACDYHGRPVRLGGVLARALGRTLVAIGTSLLTEAAVVGIALAGVAGAAVLLLGTAGGLSQGGASAFLAIVVGVVAVLTILVLSVRWALAIPVVATEDTGPIGALRRSWQLTASAAWRTFGLLLATVLVVGVLSALVSELLALVVVDVVSEAAGVTLAGETLVDVVVAVLFAPVTGVILTVYLFDQRVRKDGWDVPALEPAASRLDR